MEGVDARVAPGTDLFGVGVRLVLGPVNNDTLGVRLELPTWLGPDELEHPRGEEWQCRVDCCLGAPH